MTATRARKGSSCPSSNGLLGTDSLLTVASVGGVVNNYLVTTSVLFSNTPVPFVTTGNNAVSTANLVIRSSTVPATSSSPGVQGQVVWDSGFVYVCVATNSWKRAALTTF